MSCGLSLLGDYSSDSESESDVERSNDEGHRTQMPKVSGGKRPPGKDEDENEEPHPKAAKLPLPSDLQNMFVSKKSAKDDPSQHQGRIRAFPHEKNNWATYVYLKTDLPDHELTSLHDRLSEVMPPEIKLERIASPHVSLTRVLSLRHHWISDFVASVRQIASESPGFSLSWSDFEVFVNDEGTRTFLGLRAECSDGNSMQTLVQKLDEVVVEYRLPKFYDPPSFHISVAWCLGDMREQLANALPKLNAVVEGMIEDGELANDQEVGSLECKSGDKFFRLPLSE